jgi:zinc-binding alcohol dehydrogenase/oxidoreductase
MKALVLEGEGRDPDWKEVEREGLGAGRARVRVRAAAFNRRDLWIQRGLYPGMAYPVYLGSDGAGEVVEVGSGADGGWVGKEVIINPSLGWGDGEACGGPDFQILGMPTRGTMAEEVCVWIEQLAERPGHLSWEEAAALPLAGLTAYRALFSRGRLAAGERVVVTGAGGGVAQFLVQFAVAAGARVWVSSGDDDKIARAVELGAEGGVRYDLEGWEGELGELTGGGFELAVDGAGGPGFGVLVAVACPGGRIVNYGGTAGVVPELVMRQVFWKQLDLLGSTMGSPRDFEAMLEFVGRHGIRPVIDGIFGMEEGARALGRMAGCQQFGKLVLRP